LLERDLGLGLEAYFLGNSRLAPTFSVARLSESAITTGRLASWLAIYSDNVT
jgi:hypothetical protein